MISRQNFHDDFGGEAKIGDVAETVILVNDPLSVDAFSEVFENKVSIADHYQFRVVTGTLLEQRITICSTGIGGGPTSIALDNLVRLGANTLIYVDGSSRKTSPFGSFVATGAIREDGASLDYVRPEFPAVSDPEVLMACLAAGRDLNLAITPALFWASVRSLTPKELKLIEEFNTTVKNSERNFVPPIITSGPETATILTLSTIYRIRAGVIYSNSQNQTEVRKAISQDFRLALLAARILKEWDLLKESLGWQVMTASTTNK